MGAHSNMGVCLKSLGKFDDAASHIQAALSILTRNNEQELKTAHVANLLQNLGQVYTAAKKVKEAEDAYTKSLEINMHLNGPDHASVGLGYLCLARVHNRGKSGKVDLYRKCLKILDPQMVASGGTNQDAQVRRKRIIAELPEMPSLDRLDKLVEGVKRELTATEMDRNAGG